jgi:hypothetical protein
MDKRSFEKVWNSIVVCEGQLFQTVRGLPFTYKIRGNALVPSRTEYQISKSDFEKAFELVPFPGPGKISNLVRGPAYVWAILHDRRISSGEW